MIGNGKKEYVHRPVAQAIAEAEAAGLLVVRGDDHSLLLDLDGPDALDVYERARPAVDALFELGRRRVA